MSEDKLTEAFSESIKGDFLSCIGEYAEIGLDAILDDGLLKDVPLISTAVAIYNIGTSIRDRNYIKKLVIFLDEINRNIVDDVEREKYKSKFKENPNFRNKELEYILVIIDRYIGYDKPAMIAKLYLAYLDGILDLAEFKSYSEILDRLLPGEYEFLKNNWSYTKYGETNYYDVVLRLTGLGLYSNRENFLNSVHSTHYQEDSILRNSFRTNSEIYQITSFGKKLVDILK